MNYICVFFCHTFDIFCVCRLSPNLVFFAVSQLSLFVCYLGSICMGSLLASSCHLDTRASSGVARKNFRREVNEIFSTL